VVNPENPSVSNPEENPSLANPENPFLTIRTRSIILWGPIGLIALGFFIISLSIPWALFILFGDPDTGAVKLANPDPIFFLILFNLWLYGFITLWCLSQMRRSQLNFKQLMGRLPQNQQGFRTLLLVVPILMFSLGSGQLFLSVIAKIFPEYVASLLKENLVSPATNTSLPELYNAFIILFLVVVAPGVEELFFRGIILQRLATKWGMTAGIIVSSLMFGILHINVVGLSIFGMIMAVLYFQTRTLWVPILLHALNNGIVVLVSLFSGSSYSPVPTQNLEQFISAWRIGVLYVVLSLPWLVLYLYHNWPRKEHLLP
jgi:uncharacterized protein